MHGDQYPKRGEIYWTDLEPSRGGETKKKRPCLIVSNNIGNSTSLIVMVAPITSKVKNIYPFEVKIILINKPAKIMLNQCRAVDKSRLSEKITEIDSDTMNSFEEAIRIVFALN